MIPWVCPICGFEATGETAEEVEVEMKKHIEETKNDLLHQKTDEVKKEEEKEL